MAADEIKRESRQVNGVGPMGMIVASNVARLRNARGLTTVQLSKLMADAGRPITASSITKLELGQRKVDVDDLMVLALVLRVSPTGLLLPPNAEPTNTVDITPDETYTNDVAWNWLLGIAPLNIPEGDDGEAFMDFQTHSRPRGRRNYWKYVKDDSTDGLTYEQILAQVKSQQERDRHLPAEPPAVSEDYLQQGASETVRPFDDPSAE